MSQYAVDTQSLSFTQVDLQPPDAHANGEQSTELVAHVPLPSHKLPLAIPPLQTLAPHEVPAGYTAPHVPVPSHLPSCLQLEAPSSGQLSLCGLVCALAGPHTPS
jgi:hypothetical protein